jgi:hypothetical protein
MQHKVPSVMNFSPMFLAVVAASSLMVFPAPAGTEVVFGPVVAGPGKSVRLVSRSTTEKGTIRIEKSGRVSNGSIAYSRERDLTWTFRDPGADGTLRGMVTVAGISTSSTTTLGGKPERIEDVSPLNGKMFAMSKPPGGDWKFELDGSVPLRRVENEIGELTLYLKRKWYPQRRVALGESWEFDPAWIRMLIERDLKQAQTIGTMKLRQIRHTAAGDSAIIDVSIRSTGGNFQADGSEATAQIELSGQAVVNLKTMLDESLKLSGILVTRTGKAGETKTVTLPVNLEVTKTLVGN